MKFTFFQLKLLMPLLMFFAAAGCGRKEPVSTAVCPGVVISLPGSWEYKGAEKTGETQVFLFTRDQKSTIRAAVSPARDIPFAGQVHQDRNSLNTRRDYAIQLETETEILKNPAHIFIATTVEKGIRMKVKIILFQIERRLIYLTLKSEESSFEKAAAEFNTMIEHLQTGGKRAS